MKNEVFKISGILLVIMITFGILTGCINGKTVGENREKSNISDAPEKYDGQVVRFEYNYWTMNGSWDYKIYNENGKTYVEAKGMNGVDLYLDGEINDSVLEDITEVVYENEIYKWDEFDKKDNLIMDGYSFNILVEYDNGEKIEASGDNKKPKDFDAGHRALMKYLETIK